MIRIRRTIRSLINLPLRPINIRFLVGALRLVGWLPVRPTLSTGINRILIAQPHNSLGDLVLSLPLLDQLHRKWPQAKIHMIVGESMTDLFSNIPYVCRVIGYSPTSHQSPFALYKNICQLLMFSREQLHDAYDLALDPRWDSDHHAYLARALAFFSGARLRVGYSGRSDGVDPSLDDFLTHLALGGRNEHELTRKLKILHRTGLSNEIAQETALTQINPTLTDLAKIDRSILESFLKSAGIATDEKYAIIAPSASTPAKIWPAPSLAEVARIVNARHGLRFIVVGSSKDSEVCAQIASECSGFAVSLAGSTKVLELLALCRNATLYIGNDSGPAHLSAMVGTATVVVTVARSPSEELDDPLAPRRFRPCGPRVRLVQPDQPLSPCTLVCYRKEAHCITSVSTESVIASCEALLAEATSEGIDEGTIERSVSAS